MSKLTALIYLVASLVLVGTVAFQTVKLNEVLAKRCVNVTEVTRTVTPTPAVATPTTSTQSANTR